MHRMFFPWKKRIRALLTEWGGTASGDQALCVATVRRLLRLRVRPTLLLRAPFQVTLRMAGLAPRCVDFPMPEAVFGEPIPDRILSAFETHLPQQFQTLKKLLKETDVVMTAPGGRMFDGYVVERNVAVAFAALARNIPVINLHQSVGPAASPARRQLLREWIARSHLTVIRDQCSVGFAREMGAPEDRWIEARDMVFAERYPPAERPPEYDLGINVRFGHNGHADPRVLRDFLLRFRSQHPEHRVLVYTTTNIMSAESTALLSTAHCPIEPHPVPYPNYLRAIGRCAVHVSDSFHGVVFCALAARPVVALQPDWQTWKLQGTMAPGVPPLRPLEGFVSEEAADAVARKIHEVFARREEHAEALRQLAEYGREMAEAAWRRIEEVLRDLR